MNACVLMWTKRSRAIFVQVTEFNQIIYGICGNFFRIVFAIVICDAVLVDLPRYESTERRSNQ